LREFVEKAFAQIGIGIVWQGTGVDEKGVDPTSGRILVQVDARYFCPTEEIQSEVKTWLAAQSVVR
jgi:GDPmannose 4,6-dehydratase